MLQSVGITSGTGKTHLLIALGTIAAEAGRRVRYLTCAQLVNELAEAADDKQLTRVLGRYARLDLLCLDEIGYLTLDPRGAELLFQIITAREERASIACASNAPFSEWGNTFTDPRLAAAVVDRLTFNAHIIQTGTNSYRLTSTRAKKGAANTCRPRVGPNQASTVGPNQLVILNRPGGHRAGGVYDRHRGAAERPGRDRIRDWRLLPGVRAAR
jgi:hypothetical protein